MPDIQTLPDAEAVAELNRTLADPDVQGVDDHAADQATTAQIGDLA